MLFVPAAFLMQAIAPAAASAPPRPSVLTNPDWLHKPNGADMAKFYPQAAAAAHIEGRAVLHCNVTVAGDLADCLISDETPVGSGFGEAAMSLAPSFKMRPQTRDGVPVAGGKINIPIAFRLPPQQTMPTTAATLRCYGYAAAAAERDPSSQLAQAATFALGFLIQVRLVPENPKPSEVAEVLASQRNIAAKKLDDPNFKAERDECAALLPANGVAGFMQAVSHLTR